MMTTGSPSTPSSFCKSLLSVALLLLIHHSDAAVTVSRNCPVMTRPIGRSLRDCWIDSQSILETVVNKFPVKKDNVCLDEHQTLQSNKQLGIELMGTLDTIYCFGTQKHQDLGFDTIQKINNIHRSISEIIDSPDVCIPDMVFPSNMCFTKIDVDNYDVLYQTILRQLALLERLSMSLLVV